MTTGQIPAELQNLVLPGEEHKLTAAIKELQAEGRQPEGEEYDLTNPLERYLAAEEKELAAQGEPADDPLEGLLIPVEDGPAEEKPAEDDIPEEYRGKTIQEVIALAEAKAKAQPAPSGIPPEAYTPELGKSLYGEPLTNLFTAAEVNPLQLDATIRAGGDVSEAVEALATKAGLPKSVVQTYLDGVKAAAGPIKAELSADDGAEIRQTVGGDEQFRKLTGWAVANLSTEDLADYNAAVDSGDKAIARFAVKALQARAAAAGSAGKARTEPALVSGGRSQAPLRFTSQAQQDAAIGKTNAKGERLMHVDPAYAKRVKAALANTPDFS
jgi:hypothetical protein